MAILTSEFSRVLSAFDRDDDGKISAAEYSIGKIFGRRNNGKSERY